MRWVHSLVRSKNMNAARKPGLPKKAARTQHAELDEMIEQLEISDSDWASALARISPPLPGKDDPRALLSMNCDDKSPCQTLGNDPARSARRGFRPDPRVGARQYACPQPECQKARRRKKQAAWRVRNPDYFVTRRMGPGLWPRPSMSLFVWIWIT